MMRRRHQLSATAAVLLAVMIVSACSGQKQDSGSAASSQPDAGPPQSGGTFIWNAVVEAPTLDPHKSASAYTSLSTSGTVYSKLLEFKTGADVPYGTMEPQGDLAEEWSHSGDASTWTFHLRKGVKWQNKAPVNGREFTAADVVCTLDRIKTLPGVQLSLVQLIDTVQTPDPYTVVINLKTSFAAFDETVANYYLSILPCEGTRGEYDLATNPIGTGPFILEKWQKNVEKVYVRNPDYFIPGKPYLDEFHMVTINDPAAAIAAYRAGEIDAIPVSAQLLPSVLSSVEDSVPIKTWCVCNVHVVINQANKPFDQLKVRKAVALALDREGMAQSLGSSDYKLAGPVPSLLFGGLPPDEVGELAPYDPVQAKKLLAEAGFPNGFDVTLTTTDGYGPTVVTGAQWVQEDLKKIGINATLRVLDYATWFTTWANEDYTIGYSASSAFLSADEWLSSYFLSNGSRNWFNINDPKLDQMINEQRGIVDRDKREAKLQDISRYIIENVSNPVMTYNGESTTVTRPWVHDWHPHPEYGPSWIKNVWVDSSSPR